MRFNCDYCKERARQRRASLAEWHQWYAWWPVKVGPGDCRWLEFVQRRVWIDSWNGARYWNYRPRSD